MPSGVQMQKKWWHTENPSPCLSKASLGEFFFETIAHGARIGMVWPFNPDFDRSLVTVSVFMDEEVKAQLEAKMKYRFRLPPRIKVGGVVVEYSGEEKYDDWKPTEDVHIKNRGGQWWHSDDHKSPSLSKAAMGLYFYEVLKAKAQIGSVYEMKMFGTRSLVLSTLFMTTEMKTMIESRTPFKFQKPMGVVIDD
jgi:hypothetical protein